MYGAAFDWNAHGANIYRLFKFSNPLRPEMAPYSLPTLRWVAARIDQLLGVPEAAFLVSSFVVLCVPKGGYLYIRMMMHGTYFCSNVCTYI